MRTCIAIHSTEQARAAAGPNHRWLWKGYLATGMVTLFTSRWKTGKTTLLSFLLARMEQGGTLADAPVLPGKTVVVSEEPLSLWMGRTDRLGFGANVHWCCRPFAVRPTLDDWESLILEVAAHNADLVVFDPLAMVLPGDVENSAAAMLTALAPVQLLTQAGSAVLLLHHPRKAGPANELNPRGSGALAGAVDILADLAFLPGQPADDRRRRLRSASRLHESTRVLLELSADGLDYHTVPEPPQDCFEENWPLMKTIFEDAHERLTRQEVREYWPPDYDTPSLSTVTRLLARAVQENRLERKGKGRYHEPFVYALPGFHCPLDDLPPLEKLRW